ncbi:MAG: signal peptide peptidase SppA [Phycisphaerales bacterium]|jgi:protease-4|nr:signal peptide peptidase SppA [Phycisphaerales bacterium]
METNTNNSNQRPTTIRVLSTSGGFRTFVMFFAALLLFVVVFIIGVGTGIAGFASAIEEKGMVSVSTMHSGNSSSIAVLHVSGVIDGSNSSYATEAVDAILANKYIKSVVLRVNSPGGGVTASDEIWHEINRLKDAGLPVIASYGSVAASGGYYISCCSDYIMAQETTITGSIGVIANIMTFQDALEKLGIKPVTLIAKDSPQKSVANDVFRNWTVKDKQKVTTFLDALYKVFLNRVETGRSHVITDKKTIENVANGSAYTAQEALTNGLIDGIGYLSDAIAIAKNRANLSNVDPTILRFSPRKGGFGGLLGASSQPMSTDQLKSFLHELSSPELMYLYN